MSSSQFVLAYACDRDDPMSDKELQFRVDVATEHVKGLHVASIKHTQVGDGRTGFVVWQPAPGGTGWPAVIDRGDRAAAWVHVPTAAKGRDDGVDPVNLARDTVFGSLDRVELGAPAAAIYWDAEGLRISNDRLGMVRLYQFEVPGFGLLWSSRPGLAHIFSGLAPKLEQSTWSDMATLGWAGRGQAHLGNGRQMLGSSTTFSNNRGRTEYWTDRDTWIKASVDGDVSPLADAASGMVRSLAVSTWWPKKPIADLSGGKDSRVTAAAAIRAGVIDTVRTVNTDTGEVAVALELLRLAGNPVEHRIDSVVEPKAPEGGVFGRYLAMQRAWEGAYNARSAYRSSMFTGFRPALAPRINGLGGEAVQGRAFVNATWQKKMEGQDSWAGQQRLAQMVRSGAGAVTENSLQDSLRTIEGFVDESNSLGLNNAFMVTDYFYNFSRMPFWSMPQATPNTLLPFYSPQMLPRTMWALSTPSIESGTLHRGILAELEPSWSNVPFYKGTTKTRATPWMWENEDWNDISNTVMDGIRSLDTFSEPGMVKIIEEAQEGAGTVRHETALTRAMWELSFQDYARDIARIAEHTKEGVRRIRAESQSH